MILAFKEGKFLPMALSFVTSNVGKFKEAEHILDMPLEQILLPLEEIQGLGQEIIFHKAKSALEMLDRPLFVEDVQMECPALNGLPGPYIKDFLRALGDEGFARLIERHADRRARVICLVAYIAPNEPIAFFEGALDGTIVLPRGVSQHGQLSWDTIFQPQGMSQTFGELSLEEISQISHRQRAMSQLKRFLQKS
ncbi:MAG: hypothetical protein K0S07_1246 [Chlamydiales bacterium]|jgi:inosine triphosphate pyrophosphatase|nr:hypothetical protein [Chlamydiales bacterium]